MLVEGLAEEPAPRHRSPPSRQRSRSARRSGSARAPRWRPACCRRAPSDRRSSPRWQQFRNTSSGTASMASISAAVISRPSDSTTPLRRRPSPVAQPEHAVRRDVQDAVRLVVKLGQARRLALTFVADDRLHRVAHALEHRRHGFGLGLRAWQDGWLLRRARRRAGERFHEAFDRRIADHQRPAVHHLAHLAPELRRRQLAHDGRAQRQRPLVFVLAGWVVGKHQLPRQVGRVAVHHQHQTDPSGAPRP